MTIPSHPRSISRAKLPLAAPILLLLVSALSLGGPRALRVNFTSSMPIGVYRISVPLFLAGSLVEVCLPSSIAPFALNRGYAWKGSCSGGTQPLVKMLLAGPHERIVLTRLGVFVRGVLLPNSAPRAFDSRGRPLPSLPLGIHTIPSDGCWLYAPQARSFDSRYFGPVSLLLVQNRLDLLWTSHNPSAPLRQEAR